MTELDMDKMREACGNWDEDSGCGEDFPETCPFHQDCKEQEEKDGSGTLTDT